MTTKTAAAGFETADPEAEDKDERPNLLADFAWRLAWLRRQNRWTRKQLGERLGVSQQRIGNWEKGRHSPPIEMLAGLSRALKVTIDELILGTARSTRQRMTAEEWQAAARHLEELSRFLSRQEPDPPDDEEGDG